MIPRPTPGTYAPHYDRYLALVPEGDLREHLRAQQAALHHRFHDLNEAKALHRYAPGKWSVKEVLGHLTDTECIMAYRLLCLARGEAASLPGFDEDAYARAATFDARPLSELLRDFAAVRAASITLVEGLDAAAWRRAGLANGKAVTTPAVAFMLYGHAQHHLNVLGERYGV